MIKPILPFNRAKITKLWHTLPPAGCHYATGKHEGIDIVGLGCKNILAIMPGTVYRAGYDYDGWGKYCVVKQTDGLYAIYCHMDKLYKTAGQSVAAGEILGVEGSTGQVTGAHLHLEIRKAYSNNKSTINPTEYLGIASKVGEVKGGIKIAEVKTAAAALKVLASKKMVDSPDYWLAACDIIKNLDLLFVKIANKVQ